jgi:uncharacterized ParB-like nuclease family protein
LGRVRRRIRRCLNNYCTACYIPPLILISGDTAAQTVITNVNVNTILLQTVTRIATMGTDITKINAVITPVLSQTTRSSDGIERTTRSMPQAPSNPIKRRPFSSQGPSLYCCAPFVMQGNICAFYRKSVMTEITETGF